MIYLSDRVEKYSCQASGFKQEICVLTTYNCEGHEIVANQPESGNTMAHRVEVPFRFRVTSLQSVESPEMKYCAKLVPTQRQSHQPKGHPRPCSNVSKTHRKRKKVKECNFEDSLPHS